MDVHVPGHTLCHSQFTEVIPRATLLPSHPALIAVNGGPLPVTPVTQKNDAPSNSYELLAPRFNATVSLTSTQSTDLYSGQRAVITYRPFGESIGEHL